MVEFVCDQVVVQFVFLVLCFCYRFRVFLKGLSFSIGQFYEVGREIVQSRGLGKERGFCVFKNWETYYFRFRGGWYCENNVWFICFRFFMRVRLFIGFQMIRKLNKIGKQIRLVRLGDGVFRGGFFLQFDFYKVVGLEEKVNVRGLMFLFMLEKDLKFQVDQFKGNFCSF